MSLQLLILSPAVVIVLLFLRALISPLRSVGGPFLARFTDLWYAWRTRVGRFEFDNLELHKKYGINT